MAGPRSTLALCVPLLFAGLVAAADAAKAQSPAAPTPSPAGSPPAAPAAPAGETLDAAVEKAIERGVKHLWDLRQADGSWQYFGIGSQIFPAGPTALAAYALLECGVGPQDERMAATLDWLAKHEDNKTYTVGLRCQVWLLANRKLQNKYRKEFEADVKRLMASHYLGGYNYDCKADGKDFLFDNSNSQLALLGVWAGARANMEFIDARYWQAALKHWTSCQNAEGYWGYSPGMPMMRPTMSAAGMASLFICIDAIGSEAALRCQPPQGPEYKALEKGMDWLEKNFESSLRDENYKGQSWSDFMAYYLYGIGRVGLASGYKYLGKCDWYRAGAEWLLRKQNDKGGWGPQYETAFALLFLSRGRNPVLFNKLEYKGDWNNRPRALANLTEYISRNFEATVNWQIVNLKSPVGEWHDAPILLLSGSKAPALTDEELGKLRAFALQGGTILSVQECGNFALATAMKKVYAKLFPDYEIKAVPREHELYSVHFKLSGKPRFFVVSNGVRPLAIQVEEDMALPWQARMERTQAWAYEAAANIYLYVTDKGALRPRGTANWPGPPASPSARTVKVARLKYGGNWDPEPLAYERLGRLLAAEANIALDISAVEVKQLAASGASVASLTGTTAITLSAEERESIKKFVTGGGLLVVDAAGGARPFTESMETVLRELFGATSLQRLPDESPLLAAAPISEFRYRRQTRQRMGNAKGPLLRGIMIDGRLGVLFSPEDITEGLVGGDAFGCDGYAPRTAFEIMRNAVLLTQGSRSAASMSATAPADASQ